MTQQGHIVDFNEARAASSVRRARSYADDLAKTMANADRRRARSAARRASDLDDSSSPARARRSWSDLDSVSDASSSWQPSERTNNFASSYGNRSSRYSSQSASGATTRNQGSVPAWLADAYADLDITKEQSASAFGVDPLSARRSVDRTSRRAATPSYDAPSFEDADFGLGNTSKRHSSRYSTQRSRSANGSPTTRDDYRRSKQSPRTAVYDEEMLRDEDGIQEEKKGLFSKIANLRKSRTKDKAERQFNRQFGDEMRSNAEPAGPRAAVYKGEMGQQQRYAQRLQQSASSEQGRGFEFGSSRNSYQSSDETGHAPRATGKGLSALKIGAAVFAFIICAGAFMYPTVQSYYQTMREHDRLEAEYKAVEERNAALQSNIDTLSSDEGIAAYAHEQYGWIMPGEQSATVQGLELAPADGLENVTASVQSGSIKAPETWYSPILDKVFGFEQ